MGVKAETMETKQFDKMTDSCMDLFRRNVVRFDFWVFNDKKTYEEQGLAYADFEFEREMPVGELKAYLRGFTDGIKYRIKNPFIIVFDENNTTIVTTNEF